MVRASLSGVLVLGLLAASAPWALGVDIVTRKSGRPASGEVSAMTNAEVTVKVVTPKGEVVKVPVNDILNITWTGESARLPLGRGAENGGKFKQALETYTAVLAEVKADAPNLKAEVEYLIARTIAKQAAADPTERDAAIKKLDEFVTAHAANWHYFEAQKLLGDLYLAKADYPKAQAAFEKLVQAPWKGTQYEAKIASGRILLLMNKLPEAAAAFESVISQIPPGSDETAQRLDAMLAKAKVLIRLTKPSDALKLLVEVIQASPPDDGHLQAEAALRQGECLRALDKDKEALFAFLRVDVLFSREKASHAEALFHLAQLWDKLGQPARAEEARTKLQADFPNSDWTRQLKKSG